jgi:hypothetical protein
MASMTSKILVWVLAFLITAASAVYQRMTGPTYPMRGEVSLAGKQIKFELPRSESCGTDALIEVDQGDPSVEGVVKYKRLRSHDDWTALAMTPGDGKLSASLPQQPAAGKIVYYVYLNAGGETASLSGEEPVTLRYKGAVPIFVLLPHVLLIFLAMLFSNRTTLEAVRPNGDPYGTVGWTLGLLLIGGMILGPVMQKYAFDALWTGVPFGHDLTDNKTLIAFIAWVWAWFRNRGERRSRAAIIIAGLVLFAVYMIPHSMLGSELDYTSLPEGSSGP